MPSACPSQWWGSEASTKKAEAAVAGPSNRHPPLIIPSSGVPVYVHLCAACGACWLVCEQHEQPAVCLHACPSMQRHVRWTMPDTDRSTTPERVFLLSQSY